MSINCTMVLIINKMDIIGEEKHFPWENGEER
jgi:hypothetical protein